MYKPELNQQKLSQKCPVLFQAIDLFFLKLLDQQEQQLYYSNHLSQNIKTRMHYRQQFKHDAVSELASTIAVI